MHATRTNQHMKTRISSIMTFAVLLFLTGCSKDAQPSTSEIEQSLATQLPTFARVSSFSIKAMQNMGTKVDPEWHARIRAKVRVLSDTFAPDGTDSGVMFLRVVKRNGEAIELFGKSISKLYAGAWHTSVEIEGFPIAINGQRLELKDQWIGALGRPESAFTSTRVIIHGTETEMEKRQLAKAASLRAIEERKKMLAEAPKLLIGTWRHENSRVAYNEDGTCTAQYDSGQTSKGKWSIDGDTITFTLLEWDGKPLQKTQMYKILEITKGTLAIKDIGDTQIESHATKSK